MDFSFEVIAAWDSPGPAGSALGGPHDFQLFYVLNEGGSSEPGAFGSACIVPAGEITIPHSWDANYPLVYNFRATVPPTTASFEGRLVDELFLPDWQADTCWWSGSTLPGGQMIVPATTGRGRDWVIQANNVWGPAQPSCPQCNDPLPHNTDNVGATSPVGIEYYQSNGPNAGNCEMVFDQTMLMSCSRLDPAFLTYVPYTNNQIGFVLDGTNYTVLRDQLSRTRTWP